MSENIGLRKIWSHRLVLYNVNFMASNEKKNIFCKSKSNHCSEGELGKAVRKM